MMNHVDTTYSGVEATLSDLLSELHRLNLSERNDGISELRKFIDKRKKLLKEIRELLMRKKD
jgi:hypothetical protein